MSYINHTIKKLFFIPLAATISSSVAYATPPFLGTIFQEPNIINSSDITIYEKYSYIGQEERLVYDRRVDKYINIDAYIFSATFKNDITINFQVNPEFTLSEASKQIKEYATIMGQLPIVLLKNIETITIHKGVAAFGGGKDIVIHTGQAELYKKEKILEETLLHEAAHSLDTIHAKNPDWIDAQEKDNEFISVYAKDNPYREDIAESFLFYVAVKFKESRLNTSFKETIQKTIPHRIEYFDNQNFLMYQLPGSNIKKSIFDGAGSLINSTQNSYGCNKDIAVMHPHPDAKSTVVFQWLYNGRTCKFVDITANRDIDVVIKSKNWAGHTIQRAFKTNLSGSPVSIRRYGLWTTFAVTSTSAITDETWITAKCKKPSDTFHKGKKESIAKDPVELSLDYYWAGTGSIISNANRAHYGVDYDIAATFSKKKTLTSFQWLSTSSCSQLEISDGSSNYHKANVSIKVWKEKEFNQVCSTLPCRIDKENNFYVIKVESKANEFKGRTIKAECK
jgi:hypothetical protein